MRIACPRRGRHPAGRQRRGQDTAKWPGCSARACAVKKRHGAAAPRRGRGLVLVLVVVVVARTRALVGIAVRVELVCMVVKVVLVARAAVFVHAGAAPMPRINRARSPAPPRPWQLAVTGRAQGARQREDFKEAQARGCRRSPCCRRRQKPLCARFGGFHDTRSLAAGAPETRQAGASRTRQNPRPCPTRSAPLSALPSSRVPRQSRHLEATALPVRMSRAFWPYRGHRGPHSRPARIVPGGWRWRPAGRQADPCRPAARPRSPVLGA